MNWSKSNSEGGSYQQSVEVIRSTLLQFKVVKLNELEVGFDFDCESQDQIQQCRITAAPVQIISAERLTEA